MTQVVENQFKVKIFHFFFTFISIFLFIVISKFFIIFFFANINGIYTNSQSFEKNS